jgi:hypothetical protein
VLSETAAEKQCQDCIVSIAHDRAAGGSAEKRFPTIQRKDCAESPLASPEACT